MLNVVCIQSENYCGMGAEYVNRLFDMVRRNLDEKTVGRFICFTDDPRGIHANIEIERLPGHLKGWWNKLWLFRQGNFRHGDQVLYFDLDTIITGPLDDIAAYRGPFAILNDFYLLEFGAAIMSWKVSKNTEAIYEEYKAQRFPQENGKDGFVTGDQSWLTVNADKLDVLKHPDIFQTLFPGQFFSYKQSARFGIPKGARAICMHGSPKPHEVADWVQHIWKVGGGSSAEFVIECNSSRETIARNIRHALTLKTEWLTPQEAHGGTALVVAGGPSLAECIPSIMAHKSAGGLIFAINGTLAYLHGAHSVDADYQIILDARPENEAFVYEHPAIRIFASQCDPSLTDKADVLFHPLFDGITDITGTTDGLYLGGGTTAGLKAILVAYVLGYRKIHLYGFDSSYRAEKNHAYPQALNSGERILEVPFGGKIYHCAPWMVTQAEEFRGLAAILVEKKCELHIHGDGLIPAIASSMEVVS